MRSVIMRCARWKLNRMVSVLLDPPEISLEELFGSMMERRSIFLYVRLWAYEFWEGQQGFVWGKRGATHLGHIARWVDADRVVPVIESVAVQVEKLHEHLTEVVLRN